MRVAAAGLIAAGLTAAAPSAARAKPSVVFVRDYTGVLGRDGWGVATSTRGNYSVELPGRYRELEMKGVLLDGEDAITDVIGGFMPVVDDAGRFSVFRIEIMCSSHLDGTPPAISRQDPGVKVVPVEYSGMHGFDVRAMKVDVGMERARVLSDEHRLCLLQVDAFYGMPLLDEPIDRIFASFRISARR